MVARSAFAFRPSSWGSQSRPASTPRPASRMTARRKRIELRFMGDTPHMIGGQLTLYPSRLSLSNIFLSIDSVHAPTGGAGGTDAVARSRDGAARPVRAAVPAAVREASTPASLAN